MRDERLIIGLEGPDDAAVYRLDEDRALVATLDFFTPLVDGPDDFGAIAAANALSDLYAMRARPLFALNILAIPSGELAPEVVAGILRGAADVCREAGIPIAGGHSIDDPEPKYGLVAVGLADPRALYRKGGARPGDAIVLGKALGTGIITTGIKRGVASAEAMDAAIASMRQLNRGALDVLERFEVRAATDVSGFGLLGHLLEMCKASGLSARISAGAPIVLPGVLSLFQQGCVPGGTSRNRKAVEDAVTWDSEVDEAHRTLLCDAQTSGGLLAAVPETEAEALRHALAEAGYASAVLGAFGPEADGAGFITVDP
jgi:selenide,water dikinase